MRTATIGLVLVLGSVAFGGASQDYLTSQVERIHKWQDSRLEELESELEMTKSKLEENRRNPSKRRSLSNRVDSLEERIRAIRTWSFDPPELDSFELAPGDFGKLDAKELEVVARDRRGVVVAPIKTVGQIRSEKINQYTESEKIGQRFYDEQGPRFLMKHIARDRFAVGKKFRPKGLFEVASEEVLLSGRSMPVVYWYDVEKIRSDLQTRKKEAPYRTWKDETGEHSVDARFVKFEDGLVFLQKKDGETIQVRASRLSRKDRDWYRDFLRSQ